MTPYILDMIGQLERLATGEGEVVLAAMLAEVLRRHHGAEQTSAAL